MHPAPPSPQEILADAVTALAGDKNIITNGVQIVDYEQGTDPATGRRQVTAVAKDGQRFTGDLLVGADGIWSKVRDKMIGHTDPNYSQYTCYTGISDFTPADIDIGENGRRQAGRRKAGRRNRSGAWGAGWLAGWLRAVQHACSLGPYTRTLPLTSLPSLASTHFPATHIPPAAAPPAVGYRVFLGNGQYFVSSDVGGGKMQWYGFHKEPAGGTGALPARQFRMRACARAVGPLPVLPLLLPLLLAAPATPHK